MVLFAETIFGVQLGCKTTDSSVIKTITQLTPNNSTNNTFICVCVW